MRVTATRSSAGGARTGTNESKIACRFEERPAGYREREAAGAALLA
jgi:hypothetical protein